MKPSTPPPEGPPSRIIRSTGSVGPLGLGLILLGLAMLFGLLAGCASAPDPEECWAPWEDPVYATGRAIPAPGPDAIIPPCKEKPDAP